MLGGQFRVCCFGGYYTNLSGQFILKIKKSPIKDNLSQSNYKEI